MTVEIPFSKCSFVFVILLFFGGSCSNLHNASPTYPYVGAKTDSSTKNKHNNRLSSTQLNNQKNSLCTSSKQPNVQVDSSFVRKPYHNHNHNKIASSHINVQPPLLNHSSEPVNNNNQNLAIIQHVENLHKRFESLEEKLHETFQGSMLCVENKIHNKKIKKTFLTRFKRWKTKLKAFWKRKQKWF